MNDPAKNLPQKITIELPADLAAKFGENPAEEILKLLEKTARTADTEKIKR